MKRSAIIKGPEIVIKVKEPNCSRSFLDLFNIL